MLLRPEYMKRWPLLAVLLAGCAAPEAPIHASKVLLPHVAGTVVYLVDGWDDWLDDGGSWFEGTPIADARARWWGEQTAENVFRSLSRDSSRARLARQKVMTLRHGELAEAEFAGEAIRLRVTPRPADDAAYVELDCALTVQGRVVDKARIRASMRSTLFWSVPRGDHRRWYVLFSVREIQAR